MLFFLRPLALLLVGCMGMSYAHAQSISLTGSSQNIPEADEYFSSVWGQALSMESVCHLGLDAWELNPKYSANGVFSASSSQVSDPNLSLLHWRFPGTYAAHTQGCGFNGKHRPLDAAKYRAMSWKMRTSQPSSFALLWARNNSTPTGGLLDFDGFFLPGAAVGTPSWTWGFYNYDLQFSALPENPWSGQITGVTMIPSYLLGEGGSIEFDWVRFYDPSSAPAIPFSWTVTGVGGGAYVDLYVDDNSSGFDGQVVERQLPVSGGFSMASGALPAGTYYFYAKLVTHDGYSPANVVTSDYIGPVVINGKPEFRLTSPSMISGPEYSRDERGDSWDLEQSTDLSNLFLANGQPAPQSWKGFTDEVFSDGLFIAKTTSTSVTPVVDTQVHLSVASNRPIDPERYRYFCHRTQVDSANLPRNGNAEALDNAGWVTRFIYMQNGVVDTLGFTDDHFLYERSSVFPDLGNGFVTYCIDLWDSSVVEGGKTWRDLPWVGTARLDPLEASVPTAFAVDEAGLYAENEVNQGEQFEFTWELSEPEGEAVTISFFLDSDLSGYDGFHIGTLSEVVSGSGNFSWNAGNTAPGVYYPHVQISDGTNVQRFYSEVALNVREAEYFYRPRSRAPADFDGDGKSDFTVIRAGAAGAALWSSFLSGSFGVKTSIIGNVYNDIFLDFDSDGDRVSDESVVGVGGQFFSWLSTLSHTAFVKGDSWGVAGDIPISGDIDGDHIDDVTVFRPSDGTWWSVRSMLGFIGVSWGLPGDIPVLADYDGDGWDDIAIWRPSFAYWAVLQSSKGASPEINDIIWKQWGLPGDYPMPGDYDGDGKADLVVWRPSIAYWFVCKSSTGFDCSQGELVQFGLPGDVPLKADFDGDGILDFSVWRESTGQFFYRRSSNLQIGVVKWGGKGDYPVAAGIVDYLKRIGG